MKKFPKKFSIIFGVVVCSLIFQHIAFSSPNIALNSCYAGAYPVSNSFSRGVQGVFGFNFITRKVAENIIKGQISKQLQKGNVKVHLKSYSAGDLIAGKVKNFEVTGKNLVYNDIYISSLKAQSLCDYTHFSYKSTPPVLKTPLFVGYNAEITNDGINKIFASNSMKEALQGMPIQLSGFNMGQVDIINIKPLIANKKITMRADLAYKKAIFNFTVPISFETSLKSQDNKIYLTHLKFAPDANSEIKFITDFLELNNIEVFDLNSVEKNGSEINIKKIKIVDDKISIEGTFWQPQDTTL